MSYFNYKKKLCELCNFDFDFSDEELKIAPNIYYANFLDMTDFAPFIRPHIPPLYCLPWTITHALSLKLTNSEDKILCDDILYCYMTNPNTNTFSIVCKCLRKFNTPKIVFDKPMQNLRFQGIKTLTIEEKYLTPGMITSISDNQQDIEIKQLGTINIAFEYIIDTANKNMDDTTNNKILHLTCKRVFLCLNAANKIKNDNNKMEYIHDDKYIDNCKIEISDKFNIPKYFQQICNICNLFYFFLMQVMKQRRYIPPYLDVTNIPPDGNMLCTFKPLMHGNIPSDENDNDL
jgi:hypothetical protein